MADLYSKHTFTNGGSEIDSLLIEFDGETNKNTC